MRRPASMPLPRKQRRHRQQVQNRRRSRSRSRKRSRKRKRSRTTTSIIFLSVFDAWPSHPPLCLMGEKIWLPSQATTSVSKFGAGRLLFIPLPLLPPPGQTIVLGDSYPLARFRSAQQPYRGRPLSTCAYLSLPPVPLVSFFLCLFG